MLPPEKRRVVTLRTTGFIKVPQEFCPSPYKVRLTGPTLQTSVNGTVASEELAQYMYVIMFV